jgi:hypothetical protein
VIQSRLTVGLSKYRARYRGSDVVLFEPDSGDSEAFFTNLFGYKARERVCRHAYESTCEDLLRRASELEPILARHGIRLRHERLREGRGREPPRRLAHRLPEAARELREVLSELRQSL